MGKKLTFIVRIDRENSREYFAVQDPDSEVAMTANRYGSEGRFRLETIWRVPDAEAEACNAELDEDCRPAYTKRPAVVFFEPCYWEYSSMPLWDKQTDLEAEFLKVYETGDFYKIEKFLTQLFRRHAAGEFKSH